MTDPTICPFCGARMIESSEGPFCPKCGHPLPDDPDQDADRAEQLETDPDDYDDMGFPIWRPKSDPSDL